MCVAASFIAGVAMSSATRVGKSGRIRKQAAPARCGMNATSSEMKTMMTTRKTMMVFTSRRLLQFLSFMLLQLRTSLPCLPWKSFSIPRINVSSLSILEPTN
jgi:hypothetical protein